MSGETFSASLQNPPAPPPPVMDSLRLAFGGDGAVSYKPATAPAPAAVNGEIGGPAAAEGLNMNVVGEPVKKKRGRPKKYGPEGSIALALNSGSAGHAALSPPGGGFGSPPPPPSHGGSPTFAGPQSGDSGSASLTKRRGRPPGSSNKKRRVGAPGSCGMGFTPHVITVKAGEGRFEILSLSGSFLLSDSGGHRSRTGGLSVSLSGADGRVLGGGVAGLLTAASPVQVVVGSFMAEGHAGMKPASQVESFMVPGKFASGGAPVGPSSPPSHGTISESSGGPGSPLNQSQGVCNNSNSQGMPSMPWR